MASIAFLSCEIKGRQYGLEIMEEVGTGCKVVRLTKADDDGTVYDVVQGADRTTCDCPDWTCRHADLPYSEGCKHIRALVASGLIENVQPAATFEPEPEISENGNAIMPGTIEIMPKPKPESGPVTMGGLTLPIRLEIGDGLTFVKNKRESFYVVSAIAPDGTPRTREVFWGKQGVENTMNQLMVDALTTVARANRLAWSKPERGAEIIASCDVPTVPESLENYRVAERAASLATQQAAAPTPIVPAPSVPAPPVKAASANLVTKYRPATLSDIVGQDEIVWQLREFAEAPSETAFLFDGDTGVGKTSAALALAADLGCAVEQEELGGVYQIAAGNQLAEDVRDTLRSLALRPMFGSGWKVLIVNECDRMSEAVAYLWLDALENLPPRAIVVFSTNRVEKLPRRFVTRCERHTFRADVESIGLAAQARVNEIWYRETGRTDAPLVADLDGAIVDGQISIRACLQALNSHVRRARQEATQQAAATPTNEETANVQPARKRRKAKEDESIDWHVYGRRYASGDSYRALAKEAGVSPTLLWNRVKGLGYAPPARKVAAR